MASSTLCLAGNLESATPSGFTARKFNSFQCKTRSKKLRDFRLHRQEKFLYTLGAMDQWEWELRVVDLQDGAEGDDTPVCVGGRGATPPQDCGGPTGYRLMLKRQELGEQMFQPAQVETAIGVLAATPSKSIPSGQTKRIQRT